MSAAAGPNIVTKDLVFHVDPSDPKCYSSGSTCRDLTRINGDGTLTASVSVSSDKAFVMSVAASSRVWFNRSYVNNSDKYTFHVSAFCPNISQGNYGALISSMNELLGGIIIGFYDPDGSNPYIQFYAADDSGNINFDVTHTISPKSSFINRYYVIDGVIDGNIAKLYVNGILRATQTLVSAAGINAQSLIELGYNQAGDNWTQTNIKIYNSMIYNRVLTDREILQNFNAMKGRARLS